MSTREGTRELIPPAKNRNAESNTVVDPDKNEEAAIVRHDAAQALMAQGAGGASPQDQQAKLNLSQNSPSFPRSQYLLHLQRRYGNRYVQRMLEQSRETEQEDEVFPEVDKAVQRTRGGKFLSDGNTRLQVESDFIAKSGSGSSSGRELLTHVVQRTTEVQSKPAIDQADDKSGQKIDRRATEFISPTVRTHEPICHTGAVIQRDFLDTLGDAADTVSDVASNAADTVSDVASDAVDTVSDAASAAADAASGLIDSAIGELQGAFDAIVGQINGVWDTVKNGVNSAVDGAIREAGGFLSGIGAFFGLIGSALGSLDVDTLRSAWASITGAANAALAGVQRIVAQVTATVDGLWAGLKRLADGLIGGLRSQAEGLIGHLPGPAQGPARSLWSTIEGKLTNTWKTIESSWESLRESALKGVNQVVARVEGVVASIKNSVITTIIDTLGQVKGFFTFVKQVIANPDSLIDPIVQEITGRLQELPDKAKADAQAKAQEQAASGPGAAGSGPASAKAATAAPGAAAIQGVIQRDAAPAGAPRSTLGIGQVISGCWDFITDKLAKIWGNLGATIKEMVVGVLDPRAIWKGLKEDWGHMTEELSKRASRFESIRTDSWDGFSEDMQRFFSNLIDFPLIIWRTINAMLGRLSVYIGLAIILGGATAGAIAAGTGGAIFGGILGEGVGALPGGAAGIAAGAWAGAQAGYAVAETIGLVLLVSFVAAEQFSIQKALSDLLWVPQSEEEQSEDFNQAMDSTIAIATAALLILIAFIGVAIAKRIWAFVKGIPGRFKAKPKSAEPEPSQPKQGEPVSANPNKLVICRKCTDVPGVPEDLMAKRAKLSAETRSRLDKQADKIFPDPEKPTQMQFDDLRKFMEDMETKGGGDLEAGLQKLITEEAAQPALKVIKVDSPERIAATEPVPATGEKGNPVLNWKLFDKESKAQFSDVDVDVTDPANPGAPDQYLTPKDATLPTGEKVKLEADFRWTDESLIKNQKVWEEKFQKPLTDYSGSLADENLGNFQAEYGKIRAENPALSPQEIGDAAIRKISFGTGRIRIGFGKLRVTIEGFQDVVINMGPNKGQLVENVPTVVKVSAQKTQP